MFKLYTPGSVASEFNGSRLLSQQRAWLGDKMCPQGCYHDLLTRSLYYFPQPSHVLPFRPPLPGHMHGHLRPSIHGNGRMQDGLSPYLPFDTRLLANKSILYDALKIKFNEDGKQLTDGNGDALATTMTSPSAYSTGSNIDTLATSSSTLSPEAKKSFTCPQCKYSTDRKNNLKRHVITMHFDCDRKLECCGTVFRSKAKLREHVTLFHKNGYRCLVCARMFCRKALLRRHMAVHSGKKDFHCEFCSYATSHKSNLERHQKVHAKSARFIYSSRKPMEPFERKLCAVTTVSDVREDGVNRDEFEFRDSRETDEDFKLDEMKLLPDDESVDMSDNEHMDRNEPDNTDNCSDVDVHDDYFNKLNDERIENTDNESKEDDFDSTTTDIIPPPETTRLTTVNYLFQPFGKDIVERLYPWRESSIANIVEKAELAIVASRNKTNVNECVDDKENLECNETNDTGTLEESVKKSNRKLCPRLCGQPYRCANCGGRFESQDRLMHHQCESPESRGGDAAEKSVSLVALILKQGKNCVL